jgi:hypothetical protein
VRKVCAASAKTNKRAPASLGLAGAEINGDATVKQPSSKAESNFAHRVITL